MPLPPPPPPSAKGHTGSPDDANRVAGTRTTKRINDCVAGEEVTR